MAPAPPPDDAISDCGEHSETGDRKITPPETAAIPPPQHRSTARLQSELDQFAVDARGRLTVIARVPLLRVHETRRGQNGRARLVDPAFSARA